MTIESRMQTPWEGDIGGSIIRAQRWILTSIFPEVNDAGVLQSVMGCKSNSCPRLRSELLMKSQVLRIYLQSSGQKICKIGG